MRIVQVMPQYPFPMTDGGKVGLGNIALELIAQGHAVQVVCYAPAGTIPVHPAELNIRMVYHSTKNTPWRIATSLLRTRALYMWKHDRAAMQQAVEHAIIDGDADIVIADHTCMAPVVQRAARATKRPWALRLHNIEWMIWQRYAEATTNSVKRWFVSRQARLLRQEEAHMIAAANVALAITPVDAERARELAPTANVHVVPAGVHLQQWKRTRSPLHPPQVIMASNYSWVHNADGLRWFVEHVWPQVHHETGSSLHVVGTNVPTWLAEVHIQGVVTDGFVPDLAERYRHASVSIAPLFVGSGMRIKILEAMAAGLPVVSTTVGAEGIELFEHDGLFRADDARTMTLKLVELLKDADLCDRLGAVAQRRVDEQYSWTTAVRDMIRALETCNEG